MQLMFNIKYNLLVSIQIFLNAINALLLIKVFGVSGQVDAYLIAVSILATIQLVQLAFSEQFIIFYTGLKNKSVEEAHKFYNATLFLSAVLGIASLIILYCFKGIVFKIFAFNIDSQRLSYLNNICKVLFLGTIFMPINALNNRLLNAERRFSVPYILSALPTLFLVMAQLSIFFLNKSEIIYLAYGQTLGWMLAAIIGTVLIAKSIVPFKPVFRHYEIKPLIKNSFTTQLGGNIYNTLLPMCTNNLLVTMPAGYVSYFYYAKRIIDTLKLLTVGPAAQILKTNLSNFWVSHDLEKMRKDIRKFLNGSLKLMLGGILLSTIALPFALKLVSMGKLSGFDIKNINYIFLSLCPWYIVALMEVPYILTIFAAKKSKTVIFTNTLFITIFFVSAFVLRSKISVYSIAVGGFLGQLCNYIIFKNYAKRLINGREEIKNVDMNSIELAEVGA
jgi:O-antigen/teichoic acid export membrane protein